MFDAINADGDPIAVITAGVDMLSAQDRDGWPDSALSERLVAMLEVRSRLDAEITRLAGRWDRHQAWAADGALSGPAWLARRAPISGTKARRLVATGRMTVDHPVVEDALTAGEVTVDHVEVLTRVGGRHRGQQLDEDVDMLVANAVGLLVDDFAAAANLWAKLTDDQVADTDFMEQHQRRGLYLSSTFDGVVMVDGILDPDAGATVITVLDQLAPPDPMDAPEGPRSLPQRRADALLDLCSRYGSSDPEAPKTGVTLNAVVDVATLVGCRGGNGSNGLADVRCDVERIGAVARSTMQRLGCEAAFSRVIMDSPSVMLDLGRQVRLANGSQRRALAIRDRGCVFDGCGRPARWCDVHHLTSWLRGGFTNVDDLVLLCRRHHVLCHEGGWRLQRNEDGTIKTTTPDPLPVAQPP